MINADDVDAFRTAMKIQAENSLTKETGCHQFDVAIDPNDDSSCFLYEIYSDRAAFDVHLQSEHFLSFDKTVQPWITSKVVKTFERI